MGGGTGLPAILRGMRERLRPRSRSTITAVVTMTDDGGSSGRLRRSQGVPPPGDLRNCLLALSEREDLLSGLFQHRYGGTGDDLAGHNLGNLILCALAQQTGSFVRAVEVSSLVLRTCGRILPATHDDVVLHAQLADGSEVQGETTVDAADQAIESVWVEPREARTTPGVLEAIEDADLVVIGPGSLYTSVVPNLVLPGVGEALARTRAKVILAANLVTEPATRGLKLREHVEIIHRHAGHPILDAMVCHDGPFDEERLSRYAAEGSRPLIWTRRPIDGVHVAAVPLVSDSMKLRHDPGATVDALFDVWNRLNDATPERAGARGWTRGVAR